MSEGKYSEKAVRRSLERILSSRQFSASPRQSQLLRYLVEEKLAGRSSRLKGYSVAIDVFGRGPDFDPSEDSIVRVHMSRLRSLLEEYYAQDGKNDEPSIVLNPGAYEPRFQGPANPEQPEAEKSTRSSWLSANLTPERWIIIALLAVILGMQFSRYVWPGANPAEVASRQPEGPSVAVAAFREIGTESALAGQLRSGLQHEIVSYLSQLPNLAVLGHDTVDEREFTTEEERREADFVLAGTITVDDTGFSVNSSLIRTVDQEVIWSQRTAPTDLDTASFLTVKSEIALQIAAELGEPYGVIHEAMRNNIAIQKDVALSDYFCELEAYDYMRTKDHVERARVRECLERAVDRNPRYSNALALLSWIEGEEWRLAAGREHGENEELYQRKSLEYAKRAVRMNTTNAMAYAQLALAQYFDGNDAAALNAIERALRLSPNNTQILANAAWLYASWDSYELSDALSAKAIKLNPGHPPWYWLGAALRSIETEDPAASQRFADLYAQEVSLHAMFVRAAATRQNGRGEAADRIISSSSEVFKLSRAQIRSNLSAWRLPEKTASLVFRDRADLGP